ncbi:MAG: glycosyltransferase family 2 protein [Clostridia bacterium]|nr:glycosyltransferase family 2 protein [Clostridia bacterium]
MKLMIQIPCFNEADTLQIALDQLPKAIAGIEQLEILVIDDGSEDKTVQVAREWGVNHIVSLKHNQGLAKGFMAGIDACLHLGADIIVNTDADNQYCGEDIEKLVRPILEKKADMVIGQRPINETEHFTNRKKTFQKLGSWVVRLASNTQVPDAPSGFRAFSREAALRLNVVNEYTYTLETIIQAGWSRTAIASVLVRTNPELRPSRLFSGMWKYIQRSATVIVRAFAMYRPMRFFGIIGGIFFLAGIILGVRFLTYYFQGMGNGHVQSLVLCAALLMIGMQIFITGILADILSGNRKLLEDVQYRVRKMECEKAKAVTAVQMEDVE